MKFDDPVALIMLGLNVIMYAGSIIVIWTKQSSRLDELEAHRVKSENKIEAISSKMIDLELTLTSKLATLESSLQYLAKELEFYNRSKTSNGK